MADFNVIIKGVAIIYATKNDKGVDIWQILFPFDSCHTVRLKLNEKDSGVSLAHPAAKVSIRREKGAAFQAPDFNAPSRLSKFINLRRNDLHKDGLTFIDDDFRNTLVMTIEGGQLFVEDLTKERFQIVDQDGKPIGPPRFLGYTARIALTGAGEINMSVDGERDFSMKFNDGETVIFDNNCEPARSSGQSDFSMFYWLVEDKAAADKFFNVTPSYTDILSFLSSLFKVGILFPQNSDMGRASTSKPEGGGGSGGSDEGGDGLPCHVVVLSDPLIIP